MHTYVYVYSIYIYIYIYVYTYVVVFSGKMIHSFNDGNLMTVVLMMAI